MKKQMGLLVAKSICFFILIKILIKLHYKYIFLYLFINIHQRAKTPSA